jgi:hypothetical protein
MNTRVLRKRNVVNVDVNPFPSPHFPFPSIDMQAHGFFQRDKNNKTTTDNPQQFSSGQPTDPNDHTRNMNQQTSGVATTKIFVPIVLSALLYLLL